VASGACGLLVIEQFLAARNDAFIPRRKIKVAQQIGLKISLSNTR
jgi:hypothetical protein